VGGRREKLRIRVHDVHARDNNCSGKPARVHVARRIPSTRPVAATSSGSCLGQDEASAACIFSYSAVPAPSMLRHSNKPIRTAMACTAFFAQPFHVAMLGFSRQTPSSQRMVEARQEATARTGAGGGYEKALTLSKYMVICTDCAVSLPGVVEPGGTPAYDNAKPQLMSTLESCVRHDTLNLRQSMFHIFISHRACDVGAALWCALRPQGFDRCQHHQVAEQRWRRRLMMRRSDEAQ
jgi:hypothetical protein